MQNVKAIPGEFQHALVIADIDKKRIWKVVRKTCAKRGRITLLKDVKIRKRFEEKVTKFVDVVTPNMFDHLKDWILKACGGICRQKRGRGSNGGTWWWNEEVMEAVLGKDEAHNSMCQNSTE